MNECTDTLKQTGAIVLHTTLLLKAVLICAGLEQAGIPAWMTSDAFVHAEPEYYFFDGYTVLVPSERLAQARELLES